MAGIAQEACGLGGPGETSTKHILRGGKWVRLANTGRERGRLADSFRRC